MLNLLRNTASLKLENSPVKKVIKKATLINIVCSLGKKKKLTRNR